jgi:hypothetical protein
MWKQRLFKRLAEPLDPARVKALRRGDTLLRTVDARTIIERLNRVCPGAWSFEVEPVCTGPGAGWVVRGRLTIAGMAQEDFGVSHPEAIDPPKAAVSDALKRCAVHFGIGLELYAEGLYPPQADLTPAPLHPVPRPGFERGVELAQRVRRGEVRPMPPDALRAAIRAMAAAQPPHLADAQPGPADVRRLIIRVKRLGLTDDQRHALAERLFGVSSFKALTASQAGALWDWSADVASARTEALDLIRSEQ